MTTTCQTDVDCPMREFCHKPTKICHAYKSELGKQHFSNYVFQDPNKIRAENDSKKWIKKPGHTRFQLVCSF